MLDLVSKPNSDTEPPVHVFSWHVLGVAELSMIAVSAFLVCQFGYMYVRCAMYLCCWARLTARFLASYQLIILHVNLPATLNPSDPCETSRHILDASILLSWLRLSLYVLEIVDDFPNGHSINVFEITCSASHVRWPVWSFDLFCLVWSHSLFNSWAVQPYNFSCKNKSELRFSKRVVQFNAAHVCLLPSRKLPV